MDETTGVTVIVLGAIIIFAFIVVWMTNSDKGGGSRGSRGGNHKSKGCDFDFDFGDD